MPVLELVYREQASCTTTHFNTVDYYLVCAYKAAILRCSALISMQLLCPMEIFPEQK
jgi:hypothetical protein